MKFDWKFWLGLLVLNVISGLIIWRLAQRLGYTAPAPTTNNTSS